MKKVIKLNNPIPQEHCVYRIHERAIYGDYGEYVYATPLNTGLPNMYCQDYWLVNDQGEVHPGYCNSGVVISIENIIFPAVYLIVEDEE